LTLDGRAGLNSRTSPSTFQGHSDPAIPWLEQVLSQPGTTDRSKGEYKCHNKPMSCSLLHTKSKI
ncbi:hypothetical protein Nmel_003829, partial [Mimus melanotis]